MLEVLYASGLRVSELVSLDVAQISLNMGVIRVMGKGGKERLVPLGEEALEWVTRYTKEIRSVLLGGKVSNALFVTSRGSAMTRQAFWYLIKRHARSAGIVKRLLAAGIGDCYELGRVFRDGEVGGRHNPEFTMLELYQAYATYHEIMDLTEALIRDVAREVMGTTELSWDGATIDVAPAFRRWRMEDAVLENNPEIQRGQLRDREALAAHAQRLGIAVKAGYGWGKLLQEIFEKTVEHTLIQPTFITAHPVEVSPLARESDTDKGITDRFELFVNGKEIANGFSELNDPDDQAARFKAQVAAMDSGDDEAMHYDADYIRALEVGLPPTGGLGIGIDRLVMLLTGSASIRDVLLFPYMRPEA